MKLTNQPKLFNCQSLFLVQFEGFFREPKYHQIAWFLSQLKTCNVYHQIQLMLCLKEARQGLKKSPQIPPTINLHNMHIVQVDLGSDFRGVFEAFCGFFNTQNELNVMIDIESFYLPLKTSNLMIFWLFKSVLQLHKKSALTIK